MNQQYKLIIKKKIEHSTSTILMLSNTFQRMFL